MSLLLLWAIINSLFRFILTLVMSYELILYGDMLNKGERLGLGLMGGSAFLTIAPIMDIYKEGTPFDQWATSVFTIGTIIYVCARMTRHARHRLRNQSAAEYAAAHIERRKRQ